MIKFDEKMKLIYGQGLQIQNTSTLAALLAHYQHQQPHYNLQ